MKKIAAFALASAMTLSLAACGNPSASNSSAQGSGTGDDGKTVTLKIGNAMNSDHPWNTAIDQLCDLVSEYSDGKLELVNYPDATLGTEAELMEQVKE